MFLHDHCLVRWLCSMCPGAWNFRHDLGGRQGRRPLTCREASGSSIRTRWPGPPLLGVHTRCLQHSLRLLLLFVISEAGMKPSIWIVRVLFDRSQDHLQSRMLRNPLHSIQNFSVDAFFVYPLVRFVVPCRPLRSSRSRRRKSRESLRDPSRCSAPFGGRSRAPCGTRGGPVPRIAGE